eukprot:313319-Alexandrium_andersonii.AAC.1
MAPDVSLREGSAHRPGTDRTPTPHRQEFRALGGGPTAQEAKCWLQQPMTSLSLSQWDCKHL